MDRHVVIGTAGHIDHGKTALVRALTGVDTDGLAEEKARGITIDLGFAPLALDGAAASVVDVPGHEGFIRNMVAGATGVDVALLVVAADEGVMPQTREHLAILHHLGVRRGVVALTKCDLAGDAAWRELVADDVRALLAAELGSAWPIVEVSGATGAGLEALREALAVAAREVGTRAREDRFRLPVDRVFTLAGAGTVVTGTVWSGSVAEGDRVLVLPCGDEARVRSVQVHGRPAVAAEPGRRAALALVGLERERAERGAVVVTGEGWRAARAVEAFVTVRGLALRPRLRLRVHHGTSEVMARIARLGEETPAGRAVRLVLESPVVARAGDRIVLRSWSPVTTVGGGEITDPWADEGPRRGRGASPEAPAASDAERVVRLVTRRGAAGMRTAALEVATGLDAARLRMAAAAARGILRTGGWSVGEGAVDEAVRRMAEAVERFHREQPLEPGMPVQAWREAGGTPPLASLAEARLLAGGAIERAGAVVRRKGWAAGGSREERAAAEQVLALLRAAGAEPPSLAELSTRLPGVNVGAVLRLLAREGRAVAVAPDRYYEAAALAAERARLETILRELGPATPAAIRERLGRSRKWLIPLLEWADREGLTQRQGDRRVLRSDHA
jgi:selenocysteine-specific elongation factor